MPEPVEWTISDDQLANYPSYGWPLRCCWCTSGLGAQVKSSDVHGIMFRCQVCGKSNRVARSGTRLRVSPGVGLSKGCLLAIGVLVAYLAWLAVR